MTKGYEKHQDRQRAIQSYGKELARRAGRKCELCEGGTDIRPYDTEPNLEPAPETLALLCERCRSVADGRMDPPETLRFLEGAIWSDLPSVGKTAKAMLRRVDAEWARAALELVT